MFVKVTENFFKMTDKIVKMTDKVDKMTDDLEKNNDFFRKYDTFPLNQWRLPFFTDMSAKFETYFLTVQIQHSLFTSTSTFKQ